jgi:autotransporter-associated beta strand protein
VYPFTLSNNANGDARQWFIQSDNGGGDQMYMWSDASAAWQKGLGFKVGGGGDAHAWHHYALTYSGGTVTSYVDGTFKGTYAIAGSPNIPSFTHLLVGGRNAAWSSWEGPIDDVVVFNSVEDVTLIKAGTHPAMLGYWTGTTGPTFNWNDATNWGGTLPVSTRALIFDTSNGLTTNNNDFAANKQFKGIAFQASAGAFTLTGNAVNLTGDVTNSSTATQTISLTGGLVLDGGTRAFNAAAGDIVVNNGIGQAVSQSNGLTKSGNNTLTLTDTSSYTGATLVTAGKLLLNTATLGNTAVTVSGATATLAGSGTVGGLVTVQSSGNLSPGIDAGTPGTLNLTAGLTLNAGALNLKCGPLGAPGTNSDLINITGDLTLTGATSINLSHLVGFTTGTYDIIAYSGSLSGVGSITAPAGTMSYGYEIITTTPNKIQLRVYVPSSTKTWAGVPSGTWDISTTANWTGTGGATTYNESLAEGNDPVVFSDAATGTTAVSLNTAVQPYSVTFNNENKAYTISGSGQIAGSTGLSLVGNGTVTLSTANTFTGDTLVNLGTLVLGHTNALFGSTLNHNSAAGVLSFGSLSAVTLGGLKGTQNLDLNNVFSTAVNLTVGTNNQSNQFDGILGGLGGLNKVGDGILTLTADGSYSGGTIVNGGSVVVPNLTNTNSVTITSGSLAVTSLANASSVIVNGGVLNVQSFNSAASLAVAGGATANISGTGLSVAAVTNDGNVNFTGTTGTTTLASLAGSGTTQFGTGMNVAVGSGVSGIAYFNGATASVTTLDNATIHLASGTALTVAGGTQTTGSITGDGRLVKTGSGILTLGGSNDYAGGTSINGGTLSFSTSLPTNSITFGNGSAGILEYTGNTALAGSYNLFGTAYDPLHGTVKVTDPNGSITVNRGWNGNYWTLDKTGPGTLTLANGNSDAGDLIVSEGTVILAGTSNNIGWYDNTSGISDVKTGATLKLGNNNPANIPYFNNTFHMSGGTYDVNGFTVNGVVPAINGSGNVTNGSTTAATVNFNGYGDGSVTFSGNIADGAGMLGIGLTGGNNTWTLSGNNTYSGGTTVSSGTMKAGSTTAFSPSSAYTVSATLNLADFNNTIASLSGGGAVALGAAVLTLGDAADATFSGAITSTSGGAIVKTGAGKLTLSGTNTYNGTTTVALGTLALGAAGSIADSTGVSLATGTTLDASAKTSFAMPATQTFTFHVDGAGAGSSGRLMATALDISTAVVNFSLDSPLNDAVYVLADYTSLASGTAFATVTLPDGYDINYSYNGGTQIALVSTGGSPLIAVEQPELTDIPNNSAGSQGFGTVLTGSNSTLTFTIRNTGNAELTVGSITFDGSNPTDFSVITPPAATVAASGFTTFTVQFAPADAGARAAIMHIANNDTPKDPFNINLSGTGTTDYLEWSQDKGLTAGVNDGKEQDPDQDGHNNLAEFALDGNPLSGLNDGKVVGKVATLADASKVLTLTLPVRAGASFSGATEQVSNAVNGVVYTIQGSDTLGAADWPLVVSEITDPTDKAAIQAGLPDLTDGGWIYRTFRSPGTTTDGDPRDFLRVKTSP